MLCFNLICAEVLALGIQFQVVPHLLLMYESRNVKSLCYVLLELINNQLMYV